MRGIVSTAHTVAPYAGAWIETCSGCNCVRACRYVAPYAGAWIETKLSRVCHWRSLDGSPPTRGRGLKLPCQDQIVFDTIERVAPYAGAWIETIVAINRGQSASSRVAPYAGAWIETIRVIGGRRFSWEIVVAPYAGGVD